MLFLQGSSYLSCLARKVKVLANRSTGAKGIVVESIPSFFKAVAKSVIGIFKIDAALELAGSGG